MVECGIRVNVVADMDLDRYAAKYDLTDQYGRVVVRDLTARSAGGVHIPNLTPGTYYLYVNTHSRGRIILPQWYDRADSLSKATPIHVTEVGQIADLTVTLEKGGEILGRVVGPMGEPVPNPRLEVTTALHLYDRVYRVTDTFSDGSFHVLGLPDGDYKLGASAYGYEGAWYPGAADWDSAAVITIREHGVVDGITIRLQRRTAS
jgi:hypothetical protein